MKKFKIGISFFIIVGLCIIGNQLVLLINYLLALSLHELAHLLVAYKRGYSLKFIKLDMFGLAVELNENINTDDGFAINIAGPMFNLLICLICVAMYWFVPASFKVLNSFCFANLILALFNLLPVYPLDGGKVLKSFIKEEKTYIKTDKIVRFAIVLLCLFLFIVSVFKKLNLIWLLLSAYFLIQKKNKIPTLSIFKYTKPKKIEKVVIVKANNDANLFTLIKQIKPHIYTIFYYRNDKNNYIDQDTIIDYATKYPLTSTLKEIC